MTDFRNWLARIWNGRVSQVSRRALKFGKRPIPPEIAATSELEYFPVRVEILKCRCRTRFRKYLHIWQAI